MGSGNLCEKGNCIKVKKAEPSSFDDLGLEEKELERIRQDDMENKTAEMGEKQEGKKLKD